MERRDVLLQQLAREPLALVDQILDLEAKLAAAQAQIAELRQQNGKNDTSLEDMFIALVDTEAAAA